MKELVYIFIGGGAGSVLRYLAQIAVNERIAPFAFPFSWGTFTVNVAGSLLIGLFYSLSDHFQLSMEARLFLTAGLCGGFTTFSTFSNDALSMLEGGFYGTFAVYVFLSIVLGIGAVLLGGYIGKLIA
ncbi:MULTISPECIES: fluoride efflux transporter CrcB [Bacteroides]|uniref:fluoride efflux transporter CrcB n=1 Tax=Bacteroides TaxID=816 RepID=UPI0004B7F06C|nr:fluoride efflux transporter CrcB [Bacteroides neonati]